MDGMARRNTTSRMVLAAASVWFVLVLGCAIVAGHLLGGVERPDGSTAFDRSVTEWVVAHRAAWLTVLARALSAVGSQRLLLPAVAIVASILLGRRQLAVLGVLILGWAGALGLYTLAKYFVSRERPPEKIWLTDAAGTAFPSGHATQSLSTFVALAFVAAATLRGARRSTRALAIALAIGVGWSRVYLGVHWTTDVIAGWLIGAAWVSTVLLLSGPARWIEQRPNAEERRG